MMDPRTFLKEKVPVFKDFTADRIKELVDGSLVRSFEPNEAIAHQGAEVRACEELAMRAAYMPPLRVLR